MNSLLKKLFIIACGVSSLGSLKIEATVAKIENQDGFVQELTHQKRLVLLLVDPVQVQKKSDDQQALARLYSVFDMISNNQAYRLSRIGFATVELANLPEQTRAELQAAMGKEFDKPARAILFENGAMVMDKDEPASEDDLFDKAGEVTEEVMDMIDDVWGSYIEYTAGKRERADMNRMLHMQKKKNS